MNNFSSNYGTTLERLRIAIRKERDQDIKEELVKIHNLFDEYINVINVVEKQCEIVTELMTKICS